jgi:hypothetical protein
MSLATISGALATISGLRTVDSRPFLGSSSRFSPSYVYRLNQSKTRVRHTVSSSQRVSNTSLVSVAVYPSLKEKTDIHALLQDNKEN